MRKDLSPLVHLPLPETTTFRPIAASTTTRRASMSKQSLSYLFSLLSIATLLLLLLHHRPSAADHRFEGFDADEISDDTNSPLSHLSPPPPTPLSSSVAPPPPPPDHSSSASSDSSETQYWDEDEFEGLPPPPPPPPPPPSENTPNSIPDLNKIDPEDVRVKVRDYYVEVTSILFLILYLVNYITGKKENERLALAWGRKFAARDSVFCKNFSLLGAGAGEGEEAPLLLREGETTFKFYASGRRFCQGMLGTLELKSRHDLIARVYGVLVGSKDEITVQVFMNEDVMDHVVFALGRKKVVKTMQKEVSDLQRLGGVIAPGNGRKWVADELGVVGESKEVAGDMITETVLDQVFGDKAFEKLGEYFISMHFSDQHPGSHKKMLIFKFAMPNINHMDEMTLLVALVPYYIDLLGQYKLSPHARSKTDVSRQRVVQEIHKELLNARQEDLRRRKAEQRKKLEEAEAQFSAEILRKREAKERARQMKKAIPKTKISRN